MSQSCDHNCASCQQDCENRKFNREDFFEKPHESSHIKKFIGVVSGKGGVGKSFVTTALAVMSARKGYKTAVLDSDITGPSIPKAFGIHKRAMGNDKGILPVVTEKGIKVMSLNLLLEDETAPVVWRGPIIAGTVKQFWTDVLWEDVDYMFVDMPPGTGDVAITVFQSLPLDGLIIVTTPQELVSMIVEKAVKMAGLMNIPVIALVENMSYAVCPDCGKKFEVFGKSHVEENARQMGIGTVARLPINPEYAALCDSGRAESIECRELEGVLAAIEDL